MNLRTQLMQRAAVSVATLLFIVSAGAAMAAGPKPAGYEIPRVEAIAAEYPDDCRGKNVQQGLCLLGSEKPRAETKFVVRQVGASGSPPAEGETATVYEVKLNEWLALPPGFFEIFRADGTGDFHEARFAVPDGQVVTLKTATLRFDGHQGARLQLQHILAESTFSARGCQALVKVKGVEAVFPGTYHVALQRPGAGAEPITPRPAWRARPRPSDAELCRCSGFSVHLGPGEAAELSVGTFKAEHVLRQGDLPPAHVHRHHSGALALTNIGQYRHEVTHAGLVSDYRSFNGVHNPSDQAVDALVLWGPHFTFAIPMRVNTTPSCGLSLAKGGVPARSLLTHCVFDGEGRLTAFRINPRVYFGYMNVNGHSGSGAHQINDPVMVSGLAWTSNNREED
ncbi:MAG: hypothetical protein ACU84H_14985 [Gammaproteobacteria bacterium]